MPLQQQYLMTTKKRARLEMTKAIKEGATKEEILEVIKQQIWMKGAPTIVQVAPLLEMLNKKFEK